LGELGDVLGIANRAGGLRAETEGRTGQGPAEVARQVIDALGVLYPCDGTVRTLQCVLGEVGVTCVAPGQGADLRVSGYPRIALGARLGTWVRKMIVSGPMQTCECPDSLVRLRPRIGRPEVEDGGGQLRACIVL
jgi:hypothetical protein